MMCPDNPSKFSRRRVVQSLLAALAALCPPASVSRASSTVRPPQPTVTPRNRETRTTVEVDRFSARPVRLIGVGGAGGNTVDCMIGRGLPGVEFIRANADAEALERSAAVNTIQLGLSGLGANSQPDIGRAATAQIRAAIDGAHLLFITAGMGGGTGTGAAPVIARLARDMGILSVGVVSMPFEWEGDRRLSHAEAGLIALRANVDALFVLHNEKLLASFGDDVTQDEAFGHVIDQVEPFVFGLAEAIHSPSAMGVDYLDARTVLCLPGKTMMGCAVARGPARARIATEQALACPLSDGTDLLYAKGAIVLIATAKGNLKPSEFKLISNLVRARIAPDARVVSGVTYDETLRDRIRVTVSVTGAGIGREIHQE